MSINSILTETKTQLETTGWPVGIGDLPTNTTPEPGVGDHFFVVDYLGFGGLVESTMSKDQAIRKDGFQVTVTATTAEQCSWGVDKAEEIVLGFDYTNALWQQLREASDMVPEESGLWTCHLTFDINREGVA